MRTYTSVGPRYAVTPQSEPIPGSTQVLNSAGGYTWAVDDWVRLDRFLILGSEGGTYYIREQKLTRENAQAVERCIQADGPRVVQTIVAVSQGGRAPKNDPALLALAMCASLGNAETKAAAFAALPRVARIGTHLLHFLSFVEQFRGWGRGLRKAIAAWFNDKQPKDLAYQITKYSQRDAWAIRDALRLAHPKPSTHQHGDLYKWAAKKGDEIPWSGFATDVGDYMAGVQLIGHMMDGKAAAKVIRDLRLPREVVPTELLKSADVWDALLDDMPMTALIRNLATMTRLGLIAPMSDGLRRVADHLGDAERIQKARVHPVTVLAALLTYKSGRGVRGQNTWTPVTQVIDALDAAFYTAFGNVTPSGARILLGLDVSVSMQGTQVAGMPGLSAVQAESVMAMVTSRAEMQYACVAFDTQAHPMAVSARQRLDDVVRDVNSRVGGGTDCAQPILWAAQNRVPVDTFVIYTDSETWAGQIHPKQAIDQYRQKTGIPSKLITVAMCANKNSLGDPHDAGMLNVVGFDIAAPQIISDFSRPIPLA